MSEIPHLEKGHAVRKNHTDAISRGSGTVLKTAARLTPDLVESHPEIAGLYRGTRITKEAIAHLVIPEVAGVFPNAARAAIGNALGELMSREERVATTRDRRRETAIRNLRGNMTDEEFRESQRQRARAKRRDDIDWSEGVRKKGLTPWSDHEKSYALYLRTQPEYQHQGGPYNGLPIRLKIVEALNKIFHGGNAVRDVNSLRGFFNQPKKK